MNEKPKLRIFALWENFIIDKKERISLINNFEFFKPENIPFQYNFWICFSFVKVKQDHHVRITVQEPDGKEEELGTHDVPLHEGRVHTYFHSVELKVNSSGTFIFRGYIDDELLGETDFEVTKPIGSHSTVK